MSVSKEGLREFFDELKRYGIVMTFNKNEFGYWPAGHNVGYFTYNEQKYDVQTVGEYNPGDGKVYVALQITKDGRCLEETLNFDQQKFRFKNDLLTKLGLPPEVKIEPKHFVESCFDFFITQIQENNNGYITPSVIKEGKVLDMSRFAKKYVFDLQFVDESHENNTSVYRCNVGYRENVFLGKTRNLPYLDFATLRLEVPSQDRGINKFRVFEEIKTLEDQTLKIHQILILLGSRIPQTLDQWKTAVSDFLMRKIQTTINRKYASVNVGCPACSEHQKCPKCEQWDALERLVAAVELHMDNP